MTRQKNLFCYAMVAPALVFVALLGVYPTLATLRISFLQYDLLRIPTEGTPFVGLANYIEIFNQPRFLQTLTNTIVFVIIVVSIVLLLGLLLALVLNARFPARALVRGIALTPWFIPPVVGASIWIWMFQTDRSPINHALSSLGLIDTNIRFLTDASRFGPLSIPMLAVSAVRVWHGLPFVTIMLLAGLQSIPAELYEAASIDGASRWQKLRYITVPMLSPVLAILVSLLVIGGLGHFETNFVMTGGGPQDLTNILAVLAYQQAFTFYRFDLASAMSNVILVLTGIVAFFYIRAQVREN